MFFDILRYGHFETNKFDGVASRWFEQGDNSIAFFDPGRLKLYPQGLPNNLVTFHLIFIQSTLDLSANYHISLNLHIWGLWPHYVGPSGMGRIRIHDIMFGRTLLAVMLRGHIALCSRGHIALCSEGHFSEYFLNKLSTINFKMVWVSQRC